VDFKELFQFFLDGRTSLKIVFVGSCAPDGTPYVAPKMLVEVESPNRVYFLEYKFTQTYANIQKNSRISVSFMNDRIFTGYRLNGECEIIYQGEEYERVEQAWKTRLVAYEADRMIERIRGGFSAREAENALPDDFLVVRLEAREGSVVKPDRILKTLQGR